MRETTLKTIDDKKIIAIIRNFPQDTCIKLAEALYNGGINLVEITFNQSQPEEYYKTAEKIKALNGHFAGKLLVGAGTVTSPGLVQMAYEAGAKYMISPDCNTEVIKKTRELGLVSIPGTLTPTEMMTAHAAGADYVKLFPITSLGSEYIKAVRAPLSHLKMMAVGGVNEKNVRQFIEAGACGVGVGGNLTNKVWIENGEFEKITDCAKQFIKEINAAKK